MQHKPLSQQVVVVFGASRGIGRASALLAARRGAKVVAVARGRQALDTLAAEAAPGEVVVATADAKDFDQVRAVAELAASRFGRIDTWALATAFKAQRSKDPKSPTDADSLFEPAEGDDRVHGVVTTTSR